MAAALFIFVLLVSFNRTINRLTKPVSGLISLSLLGSAFISFFYYLKKIEGELFLSNYSKILEEINLVMHINMFSEKMTVFFSLIMTVIIGFLFYKLPRKKCYVSLMITIGLLSSLAILSIFLIDFSAIN